MLKREPRLLNRLTRHEDYQPQTALLMRDIGRVVVGDQSPTPMLLYPHSGKASIRIKLMVASLGSNFIVKCLPLRLFDLYGARKSDSEEAGRYVVPAKES